MRLYWEVARRSFRRFASYRAATIAGVFTNTVFGLIRAYVLIAVFRHRPDIGGFDVRDAVTFAFLTQGFASVAGIFGQAWLELSERIRTGDVVSDLYRPVDFQTYWLSADLGRATVQAITRGVPPFLAGAVVFDLRLPTGADTWGLFAAGVALAVVVSFGMRFIVNLTTFWLLDVRGVAQLYVVLVAFFSGLILPTVLFPDWLAGPARLLPFASVMQLPAEVFLEKHAGADLAGVFGVQVAWAIVLIVAGRVLLAAATRKVVVQGG